MNLMRPWVGWLFALIIPVRVARYLHELDGMELGLESLNWGSL